MGVPCSVLVPKITNATKVSGIEALGTTAVRASYDEYRQMAEANDSRRR